MASGRSNLASQKLRGLPWRSFDRFEGRSSLRAWLYKIATTACLTALDGRARRPLPSGLGAPSDDHHIPLVEAPSGLGWLEPAPDTLFKESSNDPATVVSRRAGVRLAFIAALQLLSPRQRVVLILSDVLGQHAKEVTGLLDSSPTAVYSILRRARAALERATVDEEELTETGAQDEQNLLDRCTDAFERADLSPLVDLLRLDVELEMPPNLTWFRGREAVIGFLGEKVLHRPCQFRLVATRANGDPALGVFGRAADGSYHPHGVHLLSTVGHRIARRSTHAVRPRRVVHRRKAPASAVDVLTSSTMTGGLQAKCADSRRHGLGRWRPPTAGQPAAAGSRPSWRSQPARWPPIWVEGRSRWVSTTIVSSPSGVSTTSTVEPPGGSVSLPGMPQLNTTR
ncbi:MAG: RNA polymerase subunit sigma-70 [Pseudonocardiales bacterium]|nr:RNA polymerase subunit sigma-70 [Pseudonocardiales bacterium]